METKIFGSSGKSLHQIWKHSTPDRTIRFKATIHLIGKGGHSSVPFRARNPIVAGTELMQMLMDKVWFEFDSFDDLVLIPVAMDSGSRHNVIPDEALLEYYGECREESVYCHLIDVTKEALTAIEVGYKVKYKVEIYRMDYKKEASHD